MGDVNPRKVVDKHPSCVAVGECRPAHRSRKSTRFWCKGRAGVPHVWEWLDYYAVVMPGRSWRRALNRVTEMQVCFGCGKHGYRRRSYCRQCGEPWAKTTHVPHPTGPPRTAPCVRCGAPHIEEAA